MIFERLTKDNKQYLEKAFKLYELSFPTYERRRFEEHLLVLENEHFHCEVMLEEETFIGILFYWLWDEWCFVEHFAIDDSLRGKQYGTRCLEAFLEHHPQVILEIEPPIEPIAIKRQRFYEKIGFKINDFEYMHPSFSKIKQPHELKLMSYPVKMTETMFSLFHSRMKNEVWTYVEH